MIVQIGRREEFDKKLLGEMHKLRAQVFKERKGWDVSVIDEMEIDGYDALSPYYMLIQEDTPEAQVFGCWRILDTTGPYMLKNTFPELLHGKEAPCSPHIWELSRFAINSGQKGSLGFSDCTLEAMRAGPLQPAERHPDAGDGNHRRGGEDDDPCRPGRIALRSAPEDRHRARGGLAHRTQCQDPDRALRGSAGGTATGGFMTGTCRLAPARSLSERERLASMPNPL